MVDIVSPVECPAKAACTVNAQRGAKGQAVLAQLFMLGGASGGRASAA